VNRIAHWNGTSWSAMGGAGINAGARALVAGEGGNVYVGGSFAGAGGVAASRVARWNGTSWSALGTGVNDVVEALAVDGEGNLYAGGHFTMAGGVSASRIAKWNGTSWSPLGAGVGGQTYAHVLALAVDGDNVYAGGTFPAAD
jgi:hypothetical protein